MSSDPRLMALPAMRKRAEEEARDIWDRHVRLFRASGWDVTERPTLTPVDGDEPRDVSDAYEITVQAQLERLADLTRPASRDAVARLVAEALGLECGATAPTLQYDADFRGWVLVGSVDEVVFNDDGVIRSGAGRTIWAPGVYEAGVTEALTLIALAVFGGSDAE